MLNDPAQTQIDIFLMILKALGNDFFETLYNRSLMLPPMSSRNSFKITTHSLQTR